MSVDAVVEIVNKVGVPGAIALLLVIWITRSLNGKLAALLAASADLSVRVRELNTSMLQFGLLVTELVTNEKQEQHDRQLARAREEGRAQARAEREEREEGRQLRREDREEKQDQRR